MIFDVSHRTAYRYSSPVVQSQHVVHLTPRRCEHQSVLRHSIMIEPAPTVRTEREDYYGNHVALLDIEMEHDELVIHARSTVELGLPRAVDLAASLPWDRIAAASPDRVTGLSVLRYAGFSGITHPTIEIADYARPSFPPGRPVLEAAWSLTERIFGDFDFDPTSTDVSTPVPKVLRQRRGVCQDFSHLALACFRAMHVPARYVSGYLLTKPLAGQPKLQGADASHAWVSVYDPDQGWVDFDPTNRLIPHGEHITLAYGRDYDDVSPISGVLLGGSEHSVSVGVDVVPVG